MLMMTFSPMSIAAFQRGRAHMRQDHHLAGAREPDQLRIDRRLMLEHVEPGAGDLAGFDQLRQRILVDHLAARGIDQIGVGPDQLQPPRRQADDRSPACAGN